MPVRARNELSLNSLFVAAILAVTSTFANATAFNLTQIDVNNAG
jgi:hypothetical protein